MNKTETIWMGFAKYGNDVSLEKMREWMTEHGHTTWNSATYYTIKKYARWTREAVVRYNNLEDVKSHVKTLGATSFSVAFYRHILEEQDMQEKPSKIEATKRIFREKGTNVPYETVESLLEQDGYTTPKDRSMLRTAKREVMAERNEKSDVQTTVLPDPPKGTPNVDLNVYRQFAALVREHGEDKVMEIVKFAEQNGAEKIQYMLEVYAESR